MIRRVAVGIRFVTLPIWAPEKLEQVFAGRKVMLREILFIELQYKI
jgi:hypothetical protein